MQSRICICCGEPISDTALKIWDDPNLCFACSHFMDAQDEMNQLGSNDYTLHQEHHSLTGVTSDDTRKEDAHNAS